MKQALVLGCSHAAGSEIFAWPTDCTQHSYPAIIAQRLGYQVTNIAIPGGSNDSIFRLLEQHHARADLIIACWSGYHRTEIWNPDTETWTALAPGSVFSTGSDLAEYQKQWIRLNSHDCVGRLNKIRNVLAANLLSKSPVINIDSFWPVDNFIWPDHCYWPVTVSFWDWCLSHNYQKTKMGHFFESAHQSFANFVLDHIDRSFIGV